MAGTHLTRIHSPEFPQVLDGSLARLIDLSAAVRARHAVPAATDPKLDAILRAIVHLNFDEADLARNVLLDAISDYNFAHEKETTHGNDAR